jgi:hypothetical protein
MFTDDAFLDHATDFRTFFVFVFNVLELLYHKVAIQKVARPSSGA